MLSSLISCIHEQWTRIFRHPSLISAGLVLVLVVQLFADFNPSFEEQVSGNLPFFRDDGELTLPLESNAELEQSMPELQIYRPSLPPPPKTDVLSPSPLS